MVDLSDLLFGVRNARVQFGAWALSVDEPGFVVNGTKDPVRVAVFDCLQSTLPLPASRGDQGMKSWANCVVVGDGGAEIGPPCSNERLGWKSLRRLWMVG